VARAVLVRVALLLLVAFIVVDLLVILVVGSG